ncbi:hypothetical protein GW17_00051853, partial [Ensete ventricosum]
ISVLRRDAGDFILHIKGRSYLTPLMLLLLTTLSYASTLSLVLAASAEDVTYDGPAYYQPYHFSAPTPPHPTPPPEDLSQVSLKRGKGKELSYSKLLSRCYLLGYTKSC